MGAKSNRVRIIAGRWRGRKLEFPDIEGLRPTSDRIRETLFNWLAPVVPGARCLDLFAGSGALGFEAASRGAAYVAMNERNPVVVKALMASQRALSADQVEITAGDAHSCLSAGSGQFDIVFLDPPFAQPQLLAQAVDLLTRGNRLKDGTYVYVEMPAGGESGIFPDGWELYRQKTAGAVSYCLYRVRRN